VRAAVSITLARKRIGERDDRIIRRSDGKTSRADCFLSINGFEKAAIADHRGSSRIIAITRPRLAEVRNSGGNARNSSEIRRSGARARKQSSLILERDHLISFGESGRARGGADPRLRSFIQGQIRPREILSIPL